MRYDTYTSHREIDTQSLIFQTYSCKNNALEKEKKEQTYSQDFRNVDNYNMESLIHKNVEVLNCSYVEIDTEIKKQTKSYRQVCIYKGRYTQVQNRQAYRQKSRVRQCDTKIDTHTILSPKSHGDKYRHTEIDKSTDT